MPSKNTSDENQAKRDPGGKSGSKETDKDKGGSTSGAKTGGAGRSGSGGSGASKR